MPETVADTSNDRRAVREERVARSDAAIGGSASKSHIVVSAVKETSVSDTCAHRHPRSSSPEVC